MNKTILLLALLMLTPPATGQLKIVTTTTDFADLARQIGGEHVEVHSVMKGPENVHNVLAKPTEMLKLNAADVFIHGGLDAEPWRDNLLKGARNPGVMRGQPGNVDMSSNITLRDVPTQKLDRSMGDVHAYGDPHYSLHPENAQRMAVTLVHALCDLDPDHCDSYKENARVFVDEMANVHRELLEKLKPYKGLKLVTFHAAWGYFAQAFGLEIVGTIEPKPGITPSPTELRRTIELMKSQNVKVVIVETHNSYDQAKFVADAAGARVLVLPQHVHGVEAADSYQDLFRHNIDAIIEAAKAAGVKPNE